MEIMLKIAVIDDERPARSELRQQLVELEPDTQITEGDCGAAALKLMEKHSFDLMFLDINLGDIKGNVLVRALKNMQPDMKIVFVTAYSEYAVEAFELEVEDYIMKPFSKDRLKKVLDRCCPKSRPVQEPAAPKRIAMNSGGKIIFEDIQNIVYIETYNRGCKIHTDTHEYCDSHTLGEYEKRLESQGFFRIHKSYLVKLDKVKEVFPWGNNSFCLHMQGYEKEMLPISREKTKTLKSLLGY